MPNRLPTTRQGEWQRVSSPSSDSGGALDQSVLRAQAAVASGKELAIGCDGSMEGILAAIGVSYLSHANEKDVRLCAREAFQPTLTELPVSMPDDSNDDVVRLAQRVYLGLCRRVGAHGALVRSRPRTSSHAPSCMQQIAYASAADDASAPEAIHRYVRLMFQKGRLVEDLVDDRRVVAVSSLARYVFNESERARQFVRFSEQRDGTFSASFLPRANVMPFVSQHFADRMRTERFVLVDERHRIAALHERDARRCELVRLDGDLAKRLANDGDVAEDEQYVRALWKTLYDALALPGRDRAARGYDLRKGWMPMRFWDGLTELKASSDDPGPKTPERYAGRCETSGGNPSGGGLSGRDLPT